MWLPLFKGCRASCPGWFIKPPTPIPGSGFWSGTFIRQLLLHHYVRICSCKRYRHYFSQTEMFTSNFQFGYLCPRGGGQAVQAGLSCPSPWIYVRQFRPSILIELYLGICSCKRYRHHFSPTEMITSNVQFDNLCSVKADLSCAHHRPGFGSGSFIRQFLLHHYLGSCSCKRYRHHFSQTEK